MNTLFIIKPRPAHNHGRMRGYLITMVANGKRRTLDVLALNSIEAVNVVRGLVGQPMTKEAA
jgi:hypothetical protein